MIVEDDVKAVTKLFKPIDNFKTIDDLFLFMKTKEPPYVGMFHAPTKQLVLTKGATEIVAFHELAHLTHFEEVGELYFSLNKLEKEMYVWKQILANRRRWTEDEFQDSLRYINDIRTNAKYKFNLEPIKL